MTTAQRQTLTSQSPSVVGALPPGMEVQSLRPPTGAPLPHWLWPARHRTPTVDHEIDLQKAGQGILPIRKRLDRDFLA